MCLLHEAVNQKTITEAVVHYTVHLLELAVTVPNPDARRKVRSRAAYFTMVVLTRKPSYR